MAKDSTRGGGSLRQSLRVLVGVGLLGLFGRFNAVAGIASYRADYRMPLLLSTLLVVIVHLAPAPPLAVLAGIAWRKSLETRSALSRVLRSFVRGPLFILIAYLVLISLSMVLRTDTEGLIGRALRFLMLPGRLVDDALLEPLAAAEAAEGGLVDAVRTWSAIVVTWLSWGAISAVFGALMGLARHDGKGDITRSTSPTFAKPIPRSGKRSSGSP